MDTFVSRGSGGIGVAGGITFGPDGNLYANSYNTGAVLRYNGRTGSSAMMRADIKGNTFMKLKSIVEFSLLAIRATLLLCFSQPLVMGQENKQQVDAINQAVANAQWKSDQADREFERRRREIEVQFSDHQADSPKIRVILQKLKNAQIALEQAQAQKAKDEARIEQENTTVQTGAGGVIGYSNVIASLATQDELRHIQNQISDLEETISKLQQDLNAAQAAHAQEAEPLAAAREAVSDKRWHDAEASARELIKLDDSNARYWRGLAFALQNQDGKDEEAVAAYRKAILVEPGDAHAYYELSQLLRRLDRNTDAETNLSAAVRLAPSEPLYRATLGDVLADQTRYAEALAVYEDAERLAPEDALLVARRRHIAIMAAGFFASAIRDSPDAADSHVLLGRALAAEGKYDEAEVEIQAALKSAPGNAAYQAALGSAYLGEVRYAEAAGALAEAVRLDPKNAVYRQQFAQALRGQARPLDALAQADAAAHLAPGDPAARQLLIVACDEALPILQAKVQETPSDAALQNQLGCVLHLLDRDSEAADALRQAVRIDPHNAVYLFDLAEVLLRQNPKDALPMLREASRRDPQNARYHNALAFALQQTGDMKAAGEEYAAAARLDPTVALYQFNNGNVLLQRSKQGDAETAFRAARRLAPDRTDYANMLGVCLYAEAGKAKARDEKDARYAEAATCFRDAIKGDPSNAVYHANLAHTLKEMGWADEAKAEAQAAVQLGADESTMQGLLEVM